MKRIALLTLTLLLTCSIGFCVPTNSVSIPNPAVANTVIQSSNYNANNNEIQSKYNAHSHTDITQLGTVTTGTWASTPPTTQFGGLGANFSTATQGSLLFFSSTGTLSERTASATGLVLTTKGDNQNPVWESPSISDYNGLPKGVVINTAEMMTSTYISTTLTSTTYDNTSPLITELCEFMRYTYTPLRIGDKLKVDVVWNGMQNGATPLTVALFTNTNTNAVKTAPATIPIDVASMYTVPMTYIMTASSLNPILFTVRAGGSSGTTYFNGDNGGAKYNGSMSSSIIIFEYKG